MAVLRYLGFAEEENYNPATPPEATQHIDIANSSLDVPSEPQLIYNGGIGRSSRLHRPGFYAPSGNIEYAFDVKTVGWFLKWLLSGYKFTAGSTGHNLHEIYGNEDTTLTSFTARLGKDLFEHVFSGCVINSLELKVEGEFTQLTADIISAKDSRADIKQVSVLLLPEEYPMAFHEVTCKLNGGDISARVKTLTLSINNNASADSGKTLGSRHPRLIRAGDRETTFTADIIYTDIDMLQKFWGGENGPSALGTEEFSLAVVFDSGEYGNMEIELPRAIFNNVKTQPSGRDELIQSIDGRAFLEQEVVLSDASVVSTEVLVTLENAEDEMVITEEPPSTS